MGNAIRYLKWEIAQIPLEMEEEEAKDWLCERIDYFVRDRIVVADKVIEQHTLSKIKDGDVVMTYARCVLVCLCCSAAETMRGNTDLPL